ncbi:MAG TPA: PKD domain-containing protein [Methanosarcina sp.]|jgi:YVTN family beta-propeller protein|nr:PKD domain-containing protein [Methanosarcina sp.]
MDSSICVIDTVTNTVTDTVDIGWAPRGVTVTPDGKKVYVADNWDPDVPDSSNYVSVIDTATNKVTAIVKVGHCPYGVAVNPAGTKVYVTNNWNNTVSVIDTATNKVVATVNVESDPSGITVTPDGKKVYVANSISDNISVIDTTNNIVTATVPVGEYPIGISVTPDGKKVYVANADSNTVSVIDTATNKVTATINGLIVTDSFGQFIAPPPKNSVLPIANFVSNVTKGYAPLSVKFTDLSESATLRNWNFGDGKSSTEKNPVHTYSKAGTYTVNLTVRNDEGTDSKLGTITVFDASALPPVADFISNVTQGYAPLSVKFTDKSKYATQWEWYFGDGTTSSKQNPTHTYPVAEKYNVTLTVTNVVGQSTKTGGVVVQSASTTYGYVANGDDNTVSVIDTANNKVTATVPVGSDPSNVAITPDGKKVYVTNLDSDDVSVIDTATNKVIATVPVETWPCGIAGSPDGKKVYVANEGGFISGKSISVINTTTNTVIATMDLGKRPLPIVITPDGKELYVSYIDSNTLDVIDTATNKVTFTFGGIGSFVNLAITPDGKKVYAVNSDSYSDVLVIDTFAKKEIARIPVGNSSGGISVNPAGTKVYVANRNSNDVSVIDVATNKVTATVPVVHPGHVEVNPAGTKVYVANVDSNTVSVIDTSTNKVIDAFNVGSDPSGIAFSPALNKVYPVSNFTSNVTSGKAPLTVAFTDKSTGDPTKWKWNFGDGTNSTKQNPIHKYSKAGNYTVTLTATNAAGSNKVTKSNYIKVTTVIKPVAAFSATPTSGKAPLKVTFTDKSKGSPTSWKWSFGDGSNSTAKNPAHTYNKAGNYTVSLTVKNAAGKNTKTIKNYITVKTAPVKPIAAFSASPTSGNVPLKVIFSDKSTGSPTSWKWSFGDGSNSTAKNPAHTYNKAGKYTVSLTVKNAAGSSTKTIKNYINVTTLKTPVAAFSATPTSGKAPLKVQFTDKSTNSPTSWKWSFGDGKTSTAKNPAYTYSKAGNYTVSLTVKNAKGSNTKTISGYIKVSKK